MDNRNYNATCWSRFVVLSSGYYDEKQGYISNKEDSFDPEEITNILKTNPKFSCKYGEHIKDSKDTNRTYCFSAWFSKNVYDPPIDRDDHCNKIIQLLAPYEYELLEYKKTHKVFYEIEICIYESGNDMLINSDIINFCHRLGIEIRINTVLLNYNPESLFE